MTTYTIGTITKVKWHYCNKKVGYNLWGHTRESYTPDELYITTDNSDGKSMYELNDSIDKNKNYAFARITEDGEIIVSNLFNSNDPKGFDQQNTYFPDNYNGMFNLKDTNNMLLEYMKKYEPNIIDISHNNYVSYYCIEYDMDNGINNTLLDYIITTHTRISYIEKKNNQLEVDKDNQKSILDYITRQLTRFRIIEKKITQLELDNDKQKNKWWNFKL
jgi:hypothetical protein